MHSPEPMVRWLLVGVFASSLFGCVERAGLFDPDIELTDAPADAPRIRFSAEVDSITLYNGDVVAVTLEDRAHGNLPVQLLVMSESRNILWRSEVRTAGAGAAVTFPIHGLPEGLPRGDKLLLTASIEDGKGRRYYATEEANLARTSIHTAAVRPVVLYQGLVLRVPAGRLTAFAPAADRGRVFYANTERGVVGSIDLSNPSLVTEVARTGSLPTNLDYRAGVLAALMDAGTEVSLFDVGSEEVTERIRTLIPPFFLRFKVNGSEADPIDAPVRPYAQTLALGCLENGGGSCGDFVAYGASGIERTGGGALRVFDVSPEREISAPAVLPRFFQAPILGGSHDEESSSVWAISGSPGSGEALTLGHQSDGLECMTQALGSGSVVASPVPGGPVYVADSQASPICGIGTRLVRLDGAWTDTAEVSVMAMRNLLGEDRIGPISQMTMSADGSRLLVLGAGRVYVLDEMLRLRGSAQIEGARSIAWIENGAVFSPTQFAVAMSSGVDIYETERLLRLDDLRFDIGPTTPGMTAVIRESDGTLVVVSAVEDGSAVVVARSRPQ